MLRKLLTSASACALLFTADPASPAIHVPADQPTIQLGIDAASDGDTVLVAPGTYTGDGNRDIYFRGKAIVVMSEGGAEATIVDCQASFGNRHRGFLFVGGEGPNAILRGFTIRNGFADGSGGGILIKSSSPKIFDCILADNESYLFSNGGGIHLFKSSAHISSCAFTSNFASHGGGISIEEGSSPNIFTCTFRNNRAGDGGAIHSIDSEATIVGCEINENRAFGEGGGVYYSDSYLTIHTCTINENTADRLGGGISTWLRGLAMITDCVIQGNVSMEDGGGINTRAGVRATGCIITGNMAMAEDTFWDGGGGILVSTGGAHLRRCTIAGNRSGYRGGGILSRGILSLDRCIVWGNCSPAEGSEIFMDSDLPVTCSAIDTSGVFIDGEIQYEGGQVFTDPLVCDAEPCENAPTTEGDYTLDARSPCLPENSPCGELIGALDLGCGSPTSVERTTWGRIKWRSSGP